MSQQDKRPPTDKPGIFFISGPQKSGTTWIQWMLESHPEIVVKGETWYFGHDDGVDSWLDRDAFRKWTEMEPVKARMQIWDAGEEKVKPIPHEQLETAAMRGMVEALLNLHWKPGIRMIGDRTPFFYCQGIETIHRLFPDAKFIHIGRDGRDAAVSLVFHSMRLKRHQGFFADEDQARRSYEFHVEGKGESVSLLGPNGAQFCASVWKTSMEAGKRAEELFGSNAVLLRYEDLIKDPYVFTPVFELLGVDTSPDVIKNCIESNRFEARTGRARGDADVSSFIRKGIAGDWKSYFTEEDKKIFKEIAGPLLIELGYENSNDW